MVWVFGWKGPSGFSAKSTAEDVTEGVDGSGLTAIVTGATSGIGKETARVLALRGVHVVMAIRNMDAARKVKESILKESPNAKVDIMELDVSSQASVRSFASEYVSSGLPLNILVLNAGISGVPFSLSKDKIESIFATNHIGHFLLTNLLLETMKSTAHESHKEGRIVFVSSELHKMTYKGGIMFDKLNDEKSYSGFSAYGQSKLANTLNANELARRLKEEGVNITANSLHPGLIATNLTRNKISSQVIFNVILKGFLKNIPQGAATTCYLALNPKVKGVSGEYFADSNISKMSKHAQDPELAKKLWDFSLTLTNSKVKMVWVLGWKGESGFSARSTTEDVTEGVDGTGLTAIVTGATSGLGAETARVLALRGVHVVMAIRNMDAASKVKESILENIPNAKIDIMELDVSSQASVRSFAAEYISSGFPLNILVLNAGIMGVPFSLSKDNIESQFATNHLGNFLLTNLLLETMKRTAHKSNKEGRIVIVSSELYTMTYKGGIMFDKLNDEKSYSSLSAYGQSKLANALHANELSRRFKEEGVNIMANSLHPGVIPTNLARHSNVMGVVFHVFLKAFLKTIPQGAATTCYLALNPKVNGVSGEYFADSNIAKTNEQAKDPELAKKLWDFSLTLTNSK